MVKNSRASIRAAARMEFARFGLSGSRVARIAQDAGVNKQLIFYYFGSKEGLYEAVVGSLAAEIENHVARVGVASRDSLRTVFSDIFNLLVEKPELGMLLVRSLSDPAANTTSPLEPLVEKLNDIIADGQGLGFFRDDVDPRVAARQASLVLVGYLVTQSGNDESHRERWLSVTIQMLLKWLAW